MVQMQKTRQKSVFFIGIGGIGMSALARWYLAQNRPLGRASAKGEIAQKWAVSGSDLAPSEITRELQNEGCRVKIGHKKANIGPETGLVIYNQAIPNNNPELERARELKIKTLSYPEALGELTRLHTAIAVAGAHGKSTTTALVSLVLMKAGLDPTVIIGTKLKEFKNKNFRKGSIPTKLFSSKGIDIERRSVAANVKPWLIIEADEFHASFLDYSPTLAIITNIDREHLDFYKNLENIKKGFLRFIGNIQKNGTLIVNADNPTLWGLKKHIEAIGKRGRIAIVWYGTHNAQILASHDRETQVNTERVVGKIRKILKIPGEHNVSNALAAYALARSLKVPEKTILSALASYRGAWRRMEYKGKLPISNSPLLFDDYGHHPTEIKATLAAFRGKYPNYKIICVFQPHQAKRLEALFKEFQAAFYDADALVLLPIYKVPGRDNPKTHYTSELLARTINPSGHLKEIRYLPSPTRLKSTLQLLVTNYQLPAKTVIVMMGAGDIVEYSKQLLSQ